MREKFEIFSSGAKIKGKDGKMHYLLWKDFDYNKDADRVGLKSEIVVRVPLSAKEEVLKDIKKFNNIVR